MTWKPELTPEKYIRVWIPAAAVPTFLGFYNFVIVPLNDTQGLIIFLLTVFWLGMRLVQFLMSFGRLLHDTSLSWYSNNLYGFVHR
ncbi:hypothetical protein B0H11DRAFT_2251055 [Mycena galericulata]|nr:hypothetical protein B0H11DRAFT_2251055 [Mycena galericulata]